MNDRTPTRPASLFDPTPSIRHSKTSRDAAKRAKPTARTIEHRITRALIERGSRGATDRELQDALGIDGNSERPRRCHLVQLGVVIDSGRTRSTPTGRKATVWIHRTAASVETGT